MAERLVRYLAIEDSLQIKIKYKLAHNNQLCVQWFDLPDEEIKKTR